MSPIGGGYQISVGCNHFAEMANESLGPGRASACSLSVANIPASGPIPRLHLYPMLAQLTPRHSISAHGRRTQTWVVGPYAPEPSGNNPASCVGAVQFQKTGPATSKQERSKSCFPSATPPKNKILQCKKLKMLLHSKNTKQSLSGLAKVTLDPASCC